MAYTTPITDRVSKIYYVESEEDCFSCDGNGVVENPAWTFYYQENGNISARHTKEERYEWFLKHGYIEDGLWNGTDGMPDQEIPCSTCDGEGKLVERVSLDEALEKLGFVHGRTNFALSGNFATAPENAGCSH